MHALLIEDTIPLAQTVVRYLANEDIACTLRTDGESGYIEAIGGSYDVIILDISLPKMSGIDICRKLREEGNTTPIIMLTSRSTQDDIVAGLNYGADDYITKPCDYRELVARIRALGRRGMSNKSTEIIRVGKLAIDPLHKTVEFDGKDIHFSRREFTLLHYFATHRGYHISRDELLEKIWGIYDDLEKDDNRGKVLEVYIGYLRKKIPGIISTRKGYGYSLAELD